MLDIINGIIESEPEIVAMVVSTVLIGLVELAKRVGLNKRWLPAIAIFFGIVLSVIYLGGGDIKKGILIGLWLGLGAIGIHSGVKNTFGKEKNNSTTTLNYLGNKRK